MLVIRLLSSFYWGRQKTFEVIGSISSVYTTCSFVAYLLARTCWKIVFIFRMAYLNRNLYKDFFVPRKAIFLKTKAFSSLIDPILSMRFCVLAE